MPHRARSRRPWRHPAASAGLALAGLLLFLWPFLRQPRPGLARAWLELTAVWALAVAVLYALARRREPAGTEGGRGERDG